MAVKPPPSRIRFLALQEDGWASAALTWLHHACTGDPLSIASASDEPAAGATIFTRVAGGAVLWVDAAASPASVPAELVRWCELPAGVRPGLLLTRAAAELPWRLGIEPRPPVPLCFETPLAGAVAQLGFPGHPLFPPPHGMRVTSWRPHATVPHAPVTAADRVYVLPEWPARARVIALAHAEGATLHDRATLWEHEMDGARILSLGALLDVAGADETIRSAAHALLEAALRYAAGPFDYGGARAAVRHWIAPTAPTPDPALVVPACAPPRAAEALPLSMAGVTAQIADTDAFAAASPAQTIHPIVLGGHRASAVLDRDGLAAVWAVGVRLLARVRVRDAVPDEIAITPLGAVRSLRLGGPARSRFRAEAQTPGGGAPQDASAGATIVERCFIPADLPAVVLEWEPTCSEGFDDGGRGPPAHHPAREPDPIRLDVSWDVDLAVAPPYPAWVAGPLRWRADPDRLAVAAAATRDVVCFLLSTTAAWHVQSSGAEHASGPDSCVPDRGSDVEGRAAGRVKEATALATAIRCGFSVELRPGQRVRLVAVLLSGAADGAVATVPAGLLRAAGLVRARAGTLRRFAQDRLTVASPEPLVDRALAAARWRMDALIREMPFHGRAFLHSGAAEVPDALAAPAHHTAGTARIALDALAAGDFEMSAETLEFLVRLVRADGTLPAHCTASGIAWGVDAEGGSMLLVLAARHHAWTGDHAFMRSLWDTLARVRASAASRSADPLATLALREIASLTESIAEPAHRLATLSGGTSGTPSEWTAWSQIEAREAERRFASWLRHARAVGAGHGNVAGLITGFVHGLLGADPDAERFRLGLRPWLPTTWERLEVRQLRFAETSIRLEWTHSDREHVFRIEQTSGAAPVRVILEPLLHASQLLDADVDGRSAALDARPIGDRLRVPVQLVLDHERCLVLRVR